MGIEPGEMEEFQAITDPMERLLFKLKVKPDDMPTMKTLDWGWKELHPDDADSLEVVLAKGHNVVNGNFFVNEVGPKGAIALANAMKTMPKLVQIDLQQWQIEHGNGVKALAEAIKAHPRLKSVKMHYNKLGPKGTKTLCEAIAGHKTLTNLDLGDNGIGVDGAKALATMLAQNTSLTRLDVSKNEDVSDSPEMIDFLKAAAAKRATPLTLLIEDSPGQKWYPGFPEKKARLIQKGKWMEQGEGYRHGVDSGLVYKKTGDA
jgi:Ran GTPase-activating protein (RanGAP) involved in mRNA processing and transport